MRVIRFKEPVSIVSFGSVASKKEAGGPLKSYFDVVNIDTSFGEKTWEKSESKIIKTAVDMALEKAKLKYSDVDVIFSGDLMNQCIASTFAIRDMNIPFLGLYGACSTMAESLCLGSVFINSGVINRAVCATSSHFCSSERQYRFPLEYASMRTPTSQWTVTGGGAVVLEKAENGPFITEILIGKVEDLGVTDQNNMGAAMAPAAASTLKTFFDETATAPDDYDAIFTGDLGSVGSELLYQLLEKDKINIRHKHHDCGVMIFNPKTQSNIHAGGSGCGCSASVLCSYILGQVKKGKLKNILFIATGALLSPTSVLQGESIPTIAHLVHISEERN